MNGRPADTASARAWGTFARSLSEERLEAELVDAEQRGCEVARRALFRARKPSTLSGWGGMTPAETVIAITEALAPVIEEARAVGLHFTVLIASDPGKPATEPPAVYSLMREAVGRYPWSLGWDRSLDSSIYCFRRLIREEILRERGLPTSTPLRRAE